MRSEASSVPGSKACREKMRRDRLNDKYVKPLYCICTLVSTGLGHCLHILSYIVFLGLKVS